MKITLLRWSALSLLAATAAFAAPMAGSQATAVIRAGIAAVSATVLIHVRAEGWVQRIHVDRIGRAVVIVILVAEITHTIDVRVRPVI